MELASRLKDLKERLSCVEERVCVGHPPCDYCGEVVGTAADLDLLNRIITLLKGLGV